MPLIKLDTAKLLGFRLSDACKSAKTGVKAGAKVGVKSL